MYKFFLATILLISSINSHAINKDHSLINDVLNAVDQRLSSSDIFARALSSNNQKVQKEALLGLGRIGDKTAILKISPFLYSPQPNIRAMAAFALGITDEPLSDDVESDNISNSPFYSSNVHTLLIAKLKTEQHPVVISRLLLAIGNVGDSKGAIADILPFLNHKDTDVVAAACDALTLAWTFHRDRVSVPNSTQVHKLFNLGLKGKKIAEHCLYTLARLRREPALFDQNQIMDVANKYSSTASKVLMLRIMGAMNNTQYLKYFIAATEKSNPESIRIEAAISIASLDFSEQNLSLLTALTQDKNNHLKVSIIDRLTLTEDTSSLNKLINSLLNDQSQWVQNQALFALFKVQPKEMNDRFLEQLNSTKFSDQQNALNILRQYKLENESTHIEILTNSKHLGIKSIASSLLIEEDAEDNVGNNVGNNAEEEASSPANKSLPAKEALKLAGKHLKMLTTKGNINIQLYTSTPFTSANFYQLASSGFYDNLIFHRVIANFVAQGGDPELTGQGGPGYSIREELYPIEHIKGTVGMATSGKDTGGSQFFFNTGNNIHLNSNYTVFARVTQGLDIIEQLEVGDQILSIKEMH